MTIENSFKFRLTDGEGISGDYDKIYQNYLMPTLKLFDSKVSINHWQLRDCVRSSITDPGKVYYIFEHSIRSLNTTKSSIQKNSHSRGFSGLGSHTHADTFHFPSNEVVRFEYKPKSFHESNGLIVCGGLVGTESDNFKSRYSLSLDDRDDVEHASNIELVRLGDGGVLMDNNSYNDRLSWKGILSLYNMESGVSTTYRLGHYINNCVELYQKAVNQYDLFSCNNDGHLYQCDVSNRGVELTRRYSDLKFALNNSSISHNGQMMVVSGDSSKFAIYHQNKLGGYFSLQCGNSTWDNFPTKVKNYPSYSLPDKSEYLDSIYEASEGDNGFYTSFSESDLQIATVFQNGICLIYDVRKMEVPIAEIASTRRHSQNGSFRVCKFSRGLDDLLFISEHQSRIHVVDVRNFMNHQVILIPDRVRGFEEDGSDSLLNSGNFTSFSSVNDPCVTTATNIPIKSLEPELLPYPKVLKISDKRGDDSQNFNGVSSHQVFINSLRKRSFQVKRYSTSNSQQYIKRIDPSIINNNVTASNRNNDILRLIRDDSNNDANNSDVISTNVTEMIPPGTMFTRTGLTVTSNHQDREFLVNHYEENNISGIDWVQDQEGNSLVIGTDYGIIKWNINSWARKSFPSFEFC